MERCQTGADDGRVIRPSAGRRVVVPGRRRMEIGTVGTGLCEDKTRLAIGSPGIASASAWTRQRMATLAAALQGDPAWNRPEVSALLGPLRASLPPTPWGSTFGTNKAIESFARL